MFKLKFKHWLALLVSIWIISSLMVLYILMQGTNNLDGKLEPEGDEKPVIVEAKDNENIQMRLQEDLTFKVYYGGMDENIIDDLMTYDMVIIEPTHISDRDLSRLQEKKVKVIGYQSLLEVGLWDGDILDQLTVDDILIEASKDRGPTADPTSAHYKDIWTKVCQDRIINRGFDGIFLDTVDHVTLFENEERDRIIKGAATWIKELKTTFPESIIIQNRGFDVFFQGTSTIVDGFMWENFDATRRLDDDKYAKLVEKTNVYAKLNGARILGLNRLNNSENLDFYAENKWLHDYVPSGTYSHYYFDNQTVDWLYKGIIDEDWVLTKEKWFVEEGALDPSVLKKAKENGIKMYLIMAIGAMDKEAILEYHLEGATIMNEDITDSEASILNNTSKAYVGYFLKKIEGALEMGYDGILLDGTKEWYDVSTNDQPSREEIYKGYARFLKTIRDYYPDINIMQYEGIMVLNSEALPYLDGFVWTDFAQSLFSDSQWQQIQIDQLNAVAEQSNWEVYIFSGDKVKAIREYCQEKGYIFIQ